MIPPGIVQGRRDPQDIAGPRHHPLLHPPTLAPDLVTVIDPDHREVPVVTPCRELQEIGIAKMTFRATVVMLAPGILMRERVAQATQAAQAIPTAAPAEAVLSVVRIYRR